MAGLPSRLRAFHHGLQSVPSLDDARHLASLVRRSGAHATPEMSGHRQYDSQGSPLGGGRKRGAEAQAIGRSRGGRTTKIHAIVDAARTSHRPRSDAWPTRRRSCRTGALISAVPPGARSGRDTAYDSDGLRRFLVERGTYPVIPNNPTRKRHHPFDEAAYRQRNLIERMFCRLKDWRRIATRYDKLASTFACSCCSPPSSPGGPD